jgi:hypothetical protein
MKTITEVQKFISNFSHWGYKVAIGRNDANISDDEHTIRVVKLLSCYSKMYKLMDNSLFGLLGRHIGKETNDHGDRIDLLRRRKVFMIKKHENVAFGSSISADNDTMYSCFLGNDCKGEADIYVVNLTVVEIDYNR